MRLSVQHVGLAAGSGALATLALALSPLGATMPPLVVPYVPVDLRLLFLPVSFVLALVVGSRARWPGPAVAVVGAAVGSAMVAHFHASAALDYAGVEWAAPGGRVDVIALPASIGSILLALWVALDQGRARFARGAEEAGVPPEEVRAADAHGIGLRNEALVTAGLAVTGLALALRIVDQFAGRARVPLPEVVALAVVLALGAVALGFKGSRRASTTETTKTRSGPK